VGGGADGRAPLVSQRTKKKRGRGRAGPTARLNGPRGLAALKAHEREREGKGRRTAWLHELRRKEGGPRGEKERRGWLGWAGKEKRGREEGFVFFKLFFNFFKPLNLNFTKLFQLLNSFQNLKHFKPFSKFS
jgi:hypothetical protein